jgi:hypothetical protein
MRRKTYPLCRHCQAAPAGRPRGLCWECYDRPTIRKRYTRRFIPLGVRDRFGPMPLPPYPTHACAGTREKLAILCIRAELGFNLWHPRDGPTAEALR